MSDYIRAIKKKFKTQYGFKPSRFADGEYCFTNLPDGEYPMRIRGKLDRVKIVNGTISCCNFGSVSVSPVSDNPKEDAFYEKAEASINTNKT